MSPEAPSERPLQGDDFTRLQTGADRDVGRIAQSSDDLLPGPAITVLDKYEGLRVLCEYGRAGSQHAAIGMEDDVGAPGQVGKEARIATMDPQANGDLADIAGAEGACLRQDPKTDQCASDLQLRTSVEPYGGSPPQPQTFGIDLVGGSVQCHRSSVYNSKDGLPRRNLEAIANLPQVTVQHDGFVDYDPVNGSRHRHALNVILSALQFYCGLVEHKLRPANGSPLRFLDQCLLREQTGVLQLRLLHIQAQFFGIYCGTNRRCLEVQ